MEDRDKVKMSFNSICDDYDEAGKDNKIVERFYFVFISFLFRFLTFLFRFYFVFLTPVSWSLNCPTSGSPNVENRTK